MVSVKQCYYELLGVPGDCTADKIRSAYRRLALQRHPDKLVQSGLSQSDATVGFQELQNAYEVLSDPKERSWYDSHRSKILFSDPNSFRNSVAPDLFSNTAFSGYSDSDKGFYKVYSDEFDKIHANEINFAMKLGIGVDVVRQAPVMGNLDSPYAQVTAFYSYWLGFSTVMDFCWVDKYDVMVVPDSTSRQLMEEENDKVRRKVRKEYNDTVRKLADFVKTRDKRVIEMKAKKSVEMQKKKEEKERKKMLEKERKERVVPSWETEWANVEDWEADWAGDWGVEKEFYCVLCVKKFTSEKQWKNHERSKKHKVHVNGAPGSSDFHEEAEGHSIYIRNLPFNASVAQLEEVFKTFGPIKPGGIQVRSSKHGFCFGFVEFEELSSMHSALEASPITVGERLAVVEEKRTTARVSSSRGGSNPSGRGRGRYPSGRGSFQSERFRGRGRYGGFQSERYGGGWGYGRNEFRDQVEPTGWE